MFSGRNVIIYNEKIQDLSRHCLNTFNFFSYLHALNILRFMRKQILIYRLAGLFMSLMLCGACDDDSGSADPVRPAVNRTVLVYMAGDNSLSDDGKGNLSLMMKGMEGTAGRLVIYFDPVSDVPHLMTLEQQGGQYVLDTLLTYAEENSASKKVLRRVIEDTKRLCPADSYGLILWSHGMSWLPKGYFFPKAYTLRDIKPDANRPRTKYFGEDRHPGDEHGTEYMEIGELAEALEGNFRFILFDACFMSSVEVAYELKDKADYIIASPAEVIAEGFPYDRILPYLWGDEADFKRICQEFYDYYNTHPNGGLWHSATVALVKTAGMKALANEANLILQGKSAFPAAEFEGVWRYPLGTYGLPDVFFDFGDYIRVMADETQYASFKEMLDKVVIYKRATTEFFGAAVPEGNYSGLSTYIPLEEWDSMNTFYYFFSWPQAVY